MTMLEWGCPATTPATAAKGIADGQRGFASSNREAGIQNKNEQEVMYMVAVQLAFLLAPVIQKYCTSKAANCV